MVDLNELKRKFPSRKPVGDAHKPPLHRKSTKAAVKAAMNAGPEPLELKLPWSRGTATDAMTGQQFLASDGAVHLTLPGYSGVLLV